MRVDEDFPPGERGGALLQVMGALPGAHERGLGLVLEERQRCSYELVDEGGELRIGHRPRVEPLPGHEGRGVLPFEAGRKLRVHLQQLVRMVEKTETIDLIMRTSPHGLKVSLVTLSPTGWVYLTSGLARMLGYTTENSWP